MRTGKKNQPFFRFVVTDKKHSSTKGRTTEILGFYNPLTKEKKINVERAKYWMSVGAKPSDTVFNFLISEKIIEGKKRPKHKKVVKEAPASAEATAGKEATSEIKAAEAAKETEAAGEAKEAEQKEEAAPEAPAENKE